MATKVVRSKSRAIQAMHARPRCQAHSKRTGLPCGNPALVGLTVCRLHGGATKLSQTKSFITKARRGQVRGVRLGGSLDVSPTEAMLAMVQEAAANVAAIRTVISMYNIEVDKDGGIALPEYYGSKYHVDSQVHILVSLYNHERDRLVRYSERAIAAGIEERKVRIAEAQSSRLAQALGKALDACAHLMSGAARDEFKRSLATELRKLGAGAET